MDLETLLDTKGMPEMMAGQDVSQIVGYEGELLDPDVPHHGGRDPMTHDRMSELTGAYVYLCNFSELHKKYRFSTLLQRVLPSLVMRNFRLHLVGDIPVAFVSWAWLSDEATERLSGGGMGLSISDYNSGDNLWFLEALAPFGHSFDMITDLYTSVFSHVPEALLNHVNGDGTLNSHRRLKRFS